MTMNLISIMQGRLSPDPNGFFQFFPEKWEEEFRLAREIGFNAIEWLWDWRNWEQNPILSDESIEKIKKAIKESGILVGSLCADYYMKKSFFGDDAIQSIELLKKLILNSKAVGIKSIVIPFLEELAIKDEITKKEIIANIKKVIPVAEQNNVKLNFETEMNSDELIDFINSFNSSFVGVCYDLGNAVSYGFNLSKDIKQLDKFIGEVHLKDRKIGTTKSVLFGQGEVNFRACFVALKDINFNSPIVLQAWRGEDYLNDAKMQLNFIKSTIDSI